MSKLTSVMAFVALLLLAGGLVAVSTNSQAGEENLPHTRFLNITGVGPTATAWFEGAPPTGAPVQDALDKFSELGYRVKTVSPSQRPIITIVTSNGSTVQDHRTEDEQFFIVFLERD